MELYTKICPECGNSFETSKSNRKFDSDRCRIDFNNRKIYNEIKVRTVKSKKLDVSRAAISEFIQQLAEEKSSNRDRQNEYITELTSRLNKIVGEIGRG